jgi:hypothetical protein
VVSQRRIRSAPADPYHKLKGELSAYWAYSVNREYTKPSIKIPFVVSLSNYWNDWNEAPRWNDWNYFPTFACCLPPRASFTLNIEP